jgi:hypothetical protein
MIDFHLGDCLDLLELGFGPIVVLTRITPQSPEDVAGFFVSAHLGQPSR